MLLFGANKRRTLTAIQQEIKSQKDARAEAEKTFVIERGKLNGAAVSNEMTTLSNAKAEMEAAKAKVLTAQTLKNNAKIAVAEAVQNAKGSITTEKALVHEQATEQEENTLHGTEAVIDQFTEGTIANLAKKGELYGKIL